MAVNVKLLGLLTILLVHVITATNAAATKNTSANPPFQQTTNSTTPRTLTVRTAPTVPDTTSVPPNSTTSKVITGPCNPNPCQNGGNCTTSPTTPPTAPTTAPSNPPTTAPSNPPTTASSDSTPTAPSNPPSNSTPTAPSNSTPTAPSNSTPTAPSNFTSTSPSNSQTTPKPTPTPTPTSTLNVSSPPTVIFPIAKLFISDFICICPTSWNGTICQEDVNECEEKNDDCEGIATCKNTPGSFECACPPGYKLNTDTKLCADENECNVNKTCEYGECENTIGSYTCKCKNGSIGTYPNCQSNPCQPNPCKNDGVCENTTTIFYCKCKNGFNGQYCKEPDTTPTPTQDDDFKTMAIAFGVVAIVLLLLLIVVIVITYGRKKNGMKNGASRLNGSTYLRGSVDSVGGVYMGEKTAEMKERERLKDHEYIEMGDPEPNHNDRSKLTAFPSTSRKQDNVYDNPAGPQFDDGNQYDDLNDDDDDSTDL